MTTKKTTIDPIKSAEANVKAAQQTVKKVTDAGKKNFDEATKNYDEAVVVGKSSFDATVKAIETVNSEFMAASKKAIDENMKVMSALFSAKTPTEFFDIQGSLFKTRYEDIVSETTRLNEVATKATTEVIAPLKSHYEDVAKKFNLPLAS